MGLRSARGARRRHFGGASRRARGGRGTFLGEEKWERGGDDWWSLSLSALGRRGEVWLVRWWGLGTGRRVFFRFV